MRPLPKYRDILLSDVISESTVASVIKTIMDINYDDTQKEEDFKDWVREPINLFINSSGGCVYDGLALVDIINKSKTPIHTVAIGATMSMGLWIFLSGHKRLIGEHTTLMYHDLRTTMSGKTADIKQNLTEMLRLQESLSKEILAKTEVKKEVLDDYIVRKAEWFIPADEAIKLKFADTYYK